MKLLGSERMGVDGQCYQRLGADFLKLLAVIAHNCLVHNRDKK